MTRHDSPASGTLTASHDAATSLAPPDAAWRDGLPTLTGRLATLREVALADAPALRALLSAAEVARFISPAPASVDGTERFIEWMQHGRREGTYVCFAVIPHGAVRPAGLFQLRALEAGFITAEWGFVLASSQWGRGVFVDAATLVADFAFGTLQVNRLEARAAVNNGRGNGALRKLGAVQEAILRRSFAQGAHYVDQVLWSIVRSDRRGTTWTSAPGLSVH